MSIIETENQHGSTFPITPYIKKFLDHIKDNPKSVLDVGAAFGITTIPCITYGAKVTAMDMEAAHLAKIKSSLTEEDQMHLTLVCGTFPEDSELINGQFDVILCSRILHFLAPKRLNQALKKLYDLLKPGGLIYTLNFTPYHDFLQRFIPEYEKRLEMGAEYPGYIKDCRPFVKEQNKLPNELHLMNKDVMISVLEAHQFKIIEAYYEAYPLELDPEHVICFDGREQICVTAMK
ncbi:class I SAM-dependent methyltransferase [Thiotrichales bacterium 19S3-7]|nr:class I SAM-dependent methyltransferase [Thiotrichales bacterium 19S3-7]MCF6801736.1 class I SAM-dependent methyltransferase [Thiotrichales bacterium 19S3-11]